jgi:FkbM family methyltransferase
MFLIKFGTTDYNIDVTEISYNSLMKYNIIRIPKYGYQRWDAFLKPEIGIQEYIEITDGNGNKKQYNDTTEIYIDTKENKCYTIDCNIPQHIVDIYPEIISNKLKLLHLIIPLKHDWFGAEIPEQILSIKYLTGSEKVLEIGSNIGRNTFIISYILNKNNNNNLVSLESNSEIYKKLVENKEGTGLNCFLENAALSKRSLIQELDLSTPSSWETTVSDVVLEGYQKVNTITFEELEKKYNITFDTLVLDCEGAFYYILSDMPEILNNINLIIMENDYHNIEHKKYIDSILKEKGLSVLYSEGGGWGPCADNFYEVWKRDTSSI